MELKDICKFFTQGKNNLRVLDNISFKVKDGELISIIGPSGCGKTTILKIIINLIKPDYGEVLINGENSRGSIQMVFQDLALFPWMTVLKNVEFPLKLMGINGGKREGMAREKISLVRLEGFEKYYPHQLSGGMKQRVALARALVCDPKILLLDEPFATLDAQTREVLQEELIKTLSKIKTTTLLVTHSIEEACFLSDRIFVLTSRPAAVKESLKVGIGGKWENRKFDKKFFQLVTKIRQLLKEEVVNGNQSV